MHLLTTFNNPRAAQAFIDYMAAHHIEIQMMPDAGGQFTLWVIQDQHIETAQAELALFLENPYAEKYQAASWEVADQKRPQFHYASPNLLSLIKAKAGVFTLFIMALCIIIFTLQTLVREMRCLMHYIFPLLLASNGKFGAGLVMLYCTFPSCILPLTYSGGGNLGAILNSALAVSD